MELNEQLTLHAADMDKLRQEMVMLYGEDKAHAAWHASATIFLSYQLEGLMRQPLMKPIWGHLREDVLRIGVQTWLAIEGIKLSEKLDPKRKEVMDLFAEAVHSLVGKMMSIRQEVAAQIMSQAGLKESNDDNG